MVAAFCNFSTHPSSSFFPRTMRIHSQALLYADGVCFHHTARTLSSREPFVVVVTSRLSLIDLCPPLITS